MSHLHSGLILGRYELLIPIAKGGMAEVWAARLHGTRGFRKVVAIKTILPGTIDNDRLEEMFLDEATLAAQIHHPHVVGTLELGEHEGMLFLVMEWVDGEALNYIIRKAATVGGMPLPISVALIGQACKGLHAAHELTDEAGQLLGVVHRDISPQNLLVSHTGSAKLVDFGIAKATERSSELTNAGEVKGKLAYMTPEQVRGKHVDRRTDIFAMGTLLYLLTTGKHPFVGDNPGETLQNICSDSPPALPSTIIDSYPQELEEVVMTALQKDPERRHATALHMLQALEKAMPRSFEASFEQNIAKFVEQVAGARGETRKKQLRIAGEMLDKNRMTMAGSTSPSSLSALALKSLQSATHSSMMQFSSATLPTQQALTPAARRYGPVIAGLGIAAVGVGLFLASLGQQTSVPAPSPALAAAAPLSGATLPERLLSGQGQAPGVPPDVSPDWSAPSDGAFEEHEEVKFPAAQIIDPKKIAPPSSAKSLSSVARAAVRGSMPNAGAPRLNWTPVKTESAGEPPPPAVVAQGAPVNPPTPVVAPTQKSSKADAWNTDSFGGRH